MSKNHLTGMLLRTCNTCGKPFSRYASKDAGLYCSRDCSSKARTGLGLTLEQHFLKSKGPTTETGCVLWTGTITSRKYGVLGCVSNGKNTQYYAHRVAYELANGPIPSGMCVCHKCDNPPCVNPDHLFLGTPLDNVADKISKNRQARGEKARSAKLSPIQVAEIRATYKPRKNTRLMLAKKFGVHISAIAQILSNHTWKHISSI